MKKSEIISRRKEIMAVIDASKLEIEHQRLNLRSLQNQCSHPNKYGTSTMGERAVYCPDCRWMS